MTRLATNLPLTISEAELMNNIIEAAYWYRWRVHHTLPAQMRGRYVTPVQGHVGLPDLVLARSGTVVLAEVKRHNGRVTSQQQAWLIAAGPCGRLWTPTQWNSGEIVATLRDGPTEYRERHGAGVIT